MTSRLEAPGCHQAVPTEITLICVTGKIEQLLVFGHPLEEKILDETHRLVRFAPGSVFGIARWLSTGFGNTISRLDILRAVRPGQSYLILPFAWPGAEPLLRLNGSDKVQYGFQIIERIAESGIDPADAAPDYWLHVGNRLAGQEPPKSYSAARHAVWKLREKIAP